MHVRCKDKLVHKNDKGTVRDAQSAYAMNVLKDALRQVGAPIGPSVRKGTE